jgi:AcrR family transcriptional regulator
MNETGGGESEEALEKRAPGRPRSEATRRAILDAALDLLHTEPYRQISIDKIALRAKVGKQSIYRWWHSKADLILEAYLARATASVPMIAETGDAFVDFESTLKRLCSVLSQPGVQKSFCSFVAEAQFDEEFRAKFYTQFVSRRQDLFGKILEQGLERGQIRADANLDETLDFVLGAVWYRLLSGTPRKLDDRYAETICDTLRASLARSPTDAKRPLRQELSMFEA